MACFLFVGDFGDGAAGRREERKLFFFEKKNQKTFDR
jgi:hypothetical protein